MNQQTARIVTDSSLGLAALFSTVIALLQTEWKVSGELLLMLLWIVFPYLLCRILSRKLLLSSRTPFRMVSVVFTIIVLLLTLASYGSLYFGTQSSTSGLAFIAVPLYILVATLIVFVPANVMLFKSDKQAQ
jgi:hypothetical protein